MNCFILEDNKSISEALKQFLIDKGCQVTTALSWETAEKLLLNGFEVFILDFMLPDIPGHQVIQNLIEKGLHKNAYFLIISGVFNEQHIMQHVPEKIKKQTFFIKKPINMEELEEKINQLKFKRNREALGKVSFDRDFIISLKKGESLNKTFDSRFLIDILISLNKHNFSGDFLIKSSKEEISMIEFESGGIVKVVSENAPSYFGNLLVEHGFSLQQEIEEALARKENKYIGQMLIEKGLLSPHMVQFILKEQTKIRLSVLISDYNSFTIKSLETSFKTEDKATPEFNRLEILDWAVECIKAKFTASWLEDFYTENENCLLQPLQSIEGTLQKNKDFLIEYNNLFKSWNSKIQLIEAFKKTELEKRKFMEMVYFGIVTESIKFIDTEKDSERLQKIQNLADAFLNKKTHNFFETLHLPWKASIQEVNKNYKAIIMAIHPDNLPPNCPNELKDICKKALQKVNEAYSVLSDKQKRQKYLEDKETQSFSSTLSLYEKGLKLLKMHNYQEAFNTFQSIQDAPFCPNDIFLYMLWTEMQAHPERLKDPMKAGEIKQKISRSPMELRISPLFWFVNGLFYSKVSQYDKAILLFKKVLKINKDFVEASRELLKINKEIIALSQNDAKKPFFQKIFPFKKSS